MGSGRGSGNPHQPQGLRRIGPESGESARVRADPARTRVLDPPGASASPEPPGGVLQAVNHSTLDTFSRPTYYRVGQRESAMTDFEIVAASVLGVLTTITSICAIVYASVHRRHLTSWSKLNPKSTVGFDRTFPVVRLHLRSDTAKCVHVERLKEEPQILIEGTIESLVGSHKFRFTETDRTFKMTVRREPRNKRVRPEDETEGLFWVHETTFTNEPLTSRRLDGVFAYGCMIQSANYFLQTVHDDLSRVFYPSLGE